MPVATCAHPLLKAVTKSATSLQSWQATLARMGVQNVSLADLVYIADNTFFNHPTTRLQVRCASACDAPK